MRNFSWNRQDLVSQKSGQLTTSTMMSLKKKREAKNLRLPWKTFRMRPTLRWFRMTRNRFSQNGKTPRADSKTNKVLQREINSILWRQPAFKTSSTKTTCCETMFIGLSKVVPTRRLATRIRNLRPLHLCHQAYRINLRGMKSLAWASKLPVHINSLDIWVSQEVRWSTQTARANLYPA